MILAGHQSTEPLLASEHAISNPSTVGVKERERIVFALEGWAAIGSSTSLEPLTPGSVLTIPAGSMPRLRPHLLLRAVIFHVDFGYLADQLRWLPHKHPLVHQLHRNLQDASTLGRLDLPSHTMNALIPPLLRAVKLSASDGQEFALLAATSEVFDIVGRASGSTTLTECAARRLPRLEIAHAIGLLRRHPGHAWTVEELAREILLSASQLTRLFRADLGVSPAAYLRQIRADRMAELLSTTTIGVGEAARQAGWISPTAATRAFKQRFGVTPRNFATTYLEMRHEAVA